MTKRIGVHLGTAGGASNAVEFARQIGANTFQIFSSSPRMWRAPKVDPAQATRMRELRAKLDVGPLVIPTRYLVLHPGSWKGLTRDEGLRLAADSIERAIDGLPVQGTGFHILIENTAGAEVSLGGSL